MCLRRMSRARLIYLLAASCRFIRSQRGVFVCQLCVCVDKYCSALEHWGALDRQERYWSRKGSSTDCRPTRAGPLGAPLLLWWTARPAAWVSPECLASKLVFGRHNWERKWPRWLTEEWAREARKNGRGEGKNWPRLEGAGKRRKEEKREWHLIGK